MQKRPWRDTQVVAVAGGRPYLDLSPKALSVSSPLPFTRLLRYERLKLSPGASSIHDVRQESTACPLIAEQVDPQ